jgi:hypothetical protein
MVSSLYLILISEVYYKEVTEILQNITIVIKKSGAGRCAPQEDLGFGFDEFGVAFQTALFKVKPGVFVLLAGAKGKELIDGQKQHIGDAEGENAHDDDPFDLTQKGDIVAVGGKNTDSQRSPDAVNQVNGEGTDGIPATIAPTRPAVLVLRIVRATASALSLLAMDPTEPPLKPNQPIQSKKAPRVTKGILEAGIALTLPSLE